ncbi:7-methylguanosine phosphate-specific 5'-nucleotidase B [Lepeophtheirus salmonis]|uniref:7-methylguanosine phosphate-specific 5'-nucleotidase B n=1 Tax=Lepeophtheirus salmonis TaxID=72036 RepID=UPI001AE71242|nr:7-methylguanosine phosphate-specific 5'-nucleotidase B-like [Lepeophtheirus salmonis]
MVNIQKEYLNSSKYKGNVMIQSPEVVDDVLERMISQGGRENLQIVADFDYTLTNYHRSDGKPGRANTSWELLNESSLVPGFFESMKQIIDKYRPIEVDPKLNTDEKILAMLNAYNEFNEQFMKHNFNDNMMEKLMLEAKSSISLRDGAKDFLENAYANGIPVLIVTAGFGEVVLRFLKKQGLYHDEYTNVMGNFLDFDSKKEHCKGIIKPYIHVYNKKGKTFLDMADDNVLKEMMKRKNIILLGDSIGDLGMSEGLHDPMMGDLLKIGFLNHDVDDKYHLNLYVSSYDIVLLDERSYDLPNFILNYITKK